jgi:hypothetical protein
MHMDCERMSSEWHEDDWECWIDPSEFRRDLALFLADEAIRRPKTEVLA